MNQLAYCNGHLIPHEKLSVSVTDVGFTLGVTVSEQLRTFNGKLFQLDEHIQRLGQSLQAIGLPNIDLEHLKNEATTLAAHNYSLLEPGDDLGLTLFVTPGSAAADAELAKPTVAMHTAPVSFQRWANKYQAGESLVVTSVRQVPANCWPPHLKCRSRMHYFLADREARQKESGARALLLDQDGFVAEASTASVLLFRADEGLIAPPEAKVLPSVSVGVIKQLTEALQLPFVHRDFTVDEVHAADEVFLSSTSPCVLPVVSVDGTNISDGKPGATYQEILAAWSARVGVDIAAQATQFAQR